MKNGFFHIILFFLAASVHGQVTLYSFPDKKEVKENQRVLFTIILEIRGEDYEQESALKMPDLSKFNTIGTSSNQHTLIDPSTGTRINQQIFYYVLDPKVSGTVKLGSALVQVSGRMYKSEPVDITVTAADKKKSIAKNSNDVFLNMQVESKSIYPNQPTVAVLRGFSKDMSNLRKFGDVTVPDQKNILINEVDTNSDIIETSENDVSSQVLAVYLIFPQKAGNVEIESFSAEFGAGKVLHSNKVLLSVKSLPSKAPKNFKNAVGKFTFELESPQDTLEVEKGKAFPVSIVLKGNGNFPNLNLPKILPSRSYHFFKPKISNSLSTSTKGMRGEVRATYLVVPDVDGHIKVRTDDFVYFDTSKQKFENIGSRNFEFEIPLAEQENPQEKTTYEKINTMTENVIKQVKIPVIPEPMRRIKHKKDFPWYLTILIFIASLLGFLTYKFIKNIRKRAINTSKPLQIAQSPTEIKNNLSFHTIQNQIQHLYGLLERKEFGMFFTVTDEIFDNFKNFVTTKYNQSVSSFIETNYGSGEAELFSRTQSRILMEKSAPQHSAELLFKLTKDLEGFFLRLNKNQ